MGRRFVNVLVKDLRGVLDRRWNLERFIFFQTVVLQRARHITLSQDIWRRIEKRLNTWEAGQFSILVEDTLRSSTQYLTAVRREETAEHRAKTFHGLVLRSFFLVDGSEVLSGGTHRVLHQHCELFCLPHVNAFPNPPPDILGCCDMGGSMESHRLKDDEAL